jgi:hypothetical protein
MTTYATEIWDHTVTVRGVPGRDWRDDMAVRLTVLARTLGENPRDVGVLSEMMAALDNATRLPEKGTK